MGDAWEYNGTVLEQFCSYISSGHRSPKEVADFLRIKNVQVLTLLSMWPGLMEAGLGDQLLEFGEYYYACYDGEEVDEILDADDDMPFILTYADDVFYLTECMHIQELVAQLREWQKTEALRLFFAVAVGEKKKEVIFCVNAQYAEKLDLPENIYLDPCAEEMEITVMENCCSLVMYGGSVMIKTDDGNIAGLKCLPGTHLKPMDEDEIIQGMRGLPSELCPGME